MPGSSHRGQSSSTAADARAAAIEHPSLPAFRRDRTLVIALLYGQESDWLRNLREGGGQVIRAGRTFTVPAPEVIDTSGADALLARLSAPERAYCRLAEKLAVLELADRLPGFGPRRVSGPE
jgi:hypothetical protein